MESKENPNSTPKDGAIKRAARWVARMFGYKAENKYARGLWYVFATAITLLAVYLVVEIVAWSVEEISDAVSIWRYEREVKSPTYLHDDDNDHVSPYVIYHDGYPGYLYHTLQGKRTLTGIQWICKSSDGDSLTFYCTVADEGYKRGYFNRFTGEVAVPAQYDKAWIFSDGLACVYDKGKVRFIDHKGKDAINKAFPYTERIDDYCFHNGLCIMLGDNNHIGLIDKQGNWAVEPQYYEVSYDTKGFWLVKDYDENYGMLDAQGKELLPIAYSDINIYHGDSCIHVCRLDHICQVLDFDCNVVNSCDYVNIELLSYDSEEIDEYGETKTLPSNCLSYRTWEWYYGLMDKKGNILTPSIYSNITAIGPDRFNCDGPQGPVVLDDKGKVCGEKL